MDGTPWSTPATVSQFAQSAPNTTLMQFSATERRRGGRRALDIGSGAGRNTLPLAAAGWDVAAIDLSSAMLGAALARVRAERPHGRVALAVGRMEQLPISDRSADLIVAHGIWNLARSGAQFRAAIREAGRAAAPGAALFLFTFSRSTLPPGLEPAANESFVFTEFSGEPQCFLTEGQILAELAAAGFAPDPALPLTEHNKPRARSLSIGGPPVIYEGAFRHDGDGAVPRRAEGAP